MPASMVRISESARNALRDLARRENVPMQTILDRAIESYRRTQFLDGVNRSYADLRATAAAWRIELEERNEWDWTTRETSGRCIAATKSTEIRRHERNL